MIVARPTVLCAALSLTSSPTVVSAYRDIGEYASAEGNP